MNVSLPQAWQQFVASQVSAGEFGNASEVVREALRLLRDQQERRALTGLALRRFKTAFSREITEEYSTVVAEVRELRL